MMIFILHFFKNSTSIAFSSNRSSPKLNQESSSSDKNDSYNLYIYNLDTTSSELLQLTNEKNDNIKIKTLSNNDMIYISDKKVFLIYTIITSILTHCKSQISIQIF